MEVKSQSEIQILLEKKTADYNQIRTNIQQIEQEQTRLQKAKDQFLTQGIELQGMIKVLQELLPKSNIAPVEAVKSLNGEPAEVK
jgi:predicted nuclease with TOPRIM domain